MGRFPVAAAPLVRSSCGMAEAYLRADRLTRSVAGRIIVDDVSFDAMRAEVLGIFGPSGSGKSSLLRLINRLDEPSSGTVWLDGVDYRGISPRDLRRRVGMILQRAYLFTGTVADNIRFGPQQRGQVIEDRRVAELLAGVALSGFENRDAATLSGGEAQRVAIARALANEPQALLMDEPTSALDEQAKQQVEQTIRRVVSEHQLTTLMVTHDAAQAARVANRVLLLRDARVVTIGTPQEVLSHA